MKEKPALVDLEIREADIEAAMREFETDNPGKSANDMTSKEFADRMMKKIISTTLRADMRKSP